MATSKVLSLVLGAALASAACAAGSSGATSTQPAPASAGPTSAASAVPAGRSPTPEPLPAVCAAPCAVGILDVAFHPGKRHVTVGTTITWRNMDPTAHTVTFLNGEIDSLDMAPGAVFAHTFDAVGTFAYHCKIHLDMLGMVIVTP
ncbi:MAG: cupredoxin domain-containing protein [Candidatus Limnocylindrales bacterium]